MRRPVRESLQKIEDHMRQLLPAYCVPQSLLFVEDIPKSASGKLDRAKVARWVGALSREEAVEFTSVTSSTSDNMPQTHAEKLLQQAWSEVLNLPPKTISRTSSFFRLGADSLSAMKLASVARALGLEMFVADIFQHPELMNMASAAKTLGHVSHQELAPFALLGDTEFPPDGLLADLAAQCDVKQDSIEDAYPATSLQEGLMTLTAKQPGAYVSQTAYKLATDIDRRRLKSSWILVARANPILRTRLVNTVGHGTLQVVLKEDCSWVQATDLQSYLVTDKDRNIDFGMPLCRFALLPDHLVMTIHHAAYDAFAFSIMLRDFQSAYTGVQLKPHRPFRYFVDYIQNIDQLSSQAFWLAELQDATTPIFPELPSPVYEPFASESLSRRVKLQRVASSGITAATLIRAAWALTVSTYTGSTDVTFGAVVSGRDAPVERVEDMVG